MPDKIKLGCRFGWHDWTKWNDHKEMVITQYPYGIKDEKLKGVSRPALLQKRQCQSCGQIGYRTEEA